MSYRQVGSKEWEVSITYQYGSTAGNDGEGDYLFTLPSSLSFDTTLPMQTIYTSNVDTDNWNLATYALPASGNITTGQSRGGAVYPIINTSTEFRILATTITDNSCQCWGWSNYPLSITDQGGINMKFAFTST